MTPRVEETMKPASANSATDFVHLATRRGPRFRLSRHFYQDRKNNMERLAVTTRIFGFAPFVAGLRVSPPAER
jgi:hypothetical protein